MSTIRSSRFLRHALALDTAACAGMSAVLVAGAGILAEPLGFPSGFLRGAGLILLPCAALLAWFASREALPRWAVHLVVVANLLWIADSVAILLMGWFAPTSLGVTVVPGQALAVAIVTELEIIGLKRSSDDQVPFAA
ncbi:hypothetical protein ACXIUS_08260 [Bosea thiooxidans]|nr:hypothetical protein [Bosea sp. (in: a-proteobacteria)]